jgi:hypothetical protein
MGSTARQKPHNTTKEYPSAHQMHSAEHSSSNSIFWVIDLLIAAAPAIHPHRPTSHQRLTATRQSLHRVSDDLTPSTPLKKSCSLTRGNRVSKHADRNAKPPGHLGSQATRFLVNTKHPIHSLDPRSSNPTRSQEKAEERYPAGGIRFLRQQHWQRSTPPALHLYLL